VARSKKAARPYHHGDLRSALLKAAVELIDQRSLAALSLRECARRAGVSHSAPYRHFADKEALLLAIARQGYTWLEASGREAIACADAPLEKLDAYCVAYVRFAFEHPVHHRLMFTHPYEPHEDDAAEDDTDPGAFDLLVRCARDVVAPGEDPMPTALAAWTLPHGLSMLMLDRRIPEHLVQTPQAVEALTRTLIARWRSDLS
jgi:AcrR family transcriptional regulator